MNNFSTAMLLSLAAVLLASEARGAEAKKKILVYTRNYVTNGKGFVHENIPFAVEAIKKIGAENDLDVDVSDDPKVFTPDNLKQYAAIVFSGTKNPAAATTGAARGSFVTVELVGTDRPGILRSVSGVFATHRVNVEELASERVNAAMGGGMLFQARATVFVPADVKLAVVRADLEKIAADLMVDLKLLPIER